MSLVLSNSNVVYDQLQDFDSGAYSYFFNPSQPVPNRQQRPHVVGDASVYQVSIPNAHAPSQPTFPSVSHLALNNVPYTRYPDVRPESLAGADNTGEFLESIHHSSRSPSGKTRQRRSFSVLDNDEQDFVLYLHLHNVTADVIARNLHRWRKGSVQLSEASESLVTSEVQRISRLAAAENSINISQQAERLAVKVKNFGWMTFAESALKVQRTGTRRRAARRAISNDMRCLAKYTEFKQKNPDKEPSSHCSWAKRGKVLFNEGSKFPYEVGDGSGLRVFLSSGLEALRHSAGA